MMKDVENQVAYSPSVDRGGWQNMVDNFKTAPGVRGSVTADPVPKRDDKRCAVIKASEAGMDGWKLCDVSNSYCKAGGAERKDGVVRAYNVNCGLGNE